MTIYSHPVMKSTIKSSKLRRAPRQKEGETDKSYQGRLRAYERDKVIRDYERSSPQGIIDPDDDDAAITPEQAAIIARLEKDALLLSVREPEWEEETEAFLEKHHENYRAERKAAIVGNLPQKQAPAGLDPLLSRLDELLDRVGGLETLVDKLARLVAVTLPERSLKPAAKAAVLEIAPELIEAFKDERVRELYETYEHVVGMGYNKKMNANFPKSIRGGYVEAGKDQTEIVCRVIPHSALIARCAAKKVFRIMEGEDSTVQNVKLALAKSGLIVTTMHAAGLARGSQVKIVMNHAEAVKRGLVKGLEPVPELPKPQPSAVVEDAPAPKDAWNEPDVVILDEVDEQIEPPSTAPLPPPSVAIPAPKKGNPRFSEWDDETTTEAVEDEGGIDTEPWEEEDEQPDEDFALFRTTEEPQKSSRAVDLFAE